MEIALVPVRAKTLSCPPPLSFTPLSNTKVRALLWAAKAQVLRDSQQTAAGFTPQMDVHKTALSKWLTHCFKDSQGH